MKKASLLLFLFILLTSCKGDQIASLKKEIEKLEKETSSQKKEIIKQTDEINFLQKKCSKLQYEKDANYLPDAYVKGFFKNTYLNLGKDKFIKKLYNYFNISKSNNLMRALNGDWANYNNLKDLLELKSNDKDLILGMASFSRQKEHLANFFTDETIANIAAYFKGNTLYQDSKAKLYVQNLLLTYNRFEYGDEELLEKFYSISWPSEESWELMNELSRDSDEEMVYEDYYLYSFWARRHHEGNMQVTYRILEKIHRAIITTDNDEEQNATDENEDF